MDDILQFSYSQQHGTFSFSFMQDGKFMVTYKFQTPDVRSPRVWKHACQPLPVLSF